MIAVKCLPMFITLDPNRICHYITFVLVTIELTRLLFWLARRANAMHKSELAEQTDRLRLEVNRLQQTLETATDESSTESPTD